MSTLPLKEYLEQPGVSQEALAASLGVVQAAISQMLRSGRAITVTVAVDGSVTATETRQVPARPKKAA